MKLLALPDYEGAALCQLLVPQVIWWAPQRMETEKLPQAMITQTSYISYYTDRATASCSRIFWWRDGTQQFRLPNHREGWDVDSTVMTPARGSLL